MEEWLEADESLEVLGWACLSMLSSALQLYFRAWEAELGIKWEPGEREKAFENGYLPGYMACFEQVLKIDWRECPADLRILEQVTLARNRDQHPRHIAIQQVTHSPADRRKFPDLFFADEKELALHPPRDGEIGRWFQPSVRVPKEKFLTAVGEVERLAEWLEKRLLDAKYPGWRHR